MCSFKVKVINKILAINAALSLISKISYNFFFFFGGVSGNVLVMLQFFSLFCSFKKKKSFQRKVLILDNGRNLYLGGCCSAMINKHLLQINYCYEFNLHWVPQYIPCGQDTCRFPTHNSSQFSSSVRNRFFMANILLLSIGLVSHETKLYLVSPCEHWKRNGWRVNTLSDFIKFLVAFNKMFISIDSIHSYY